MTVLVLDQAWGEGATYTGCIAAHPRPRPSAPVPSACVPSPLTPPPVAVGSGVGVGLRGMGCMRLPTAGHAGLTPIPRMSLMSRPTKGENTWKKETEGGQ